MEIPGQAPSSEIHRQRGAADSAGRSGDGDDLRTLDDSGGRIAAAAEEPRDDLHQLAGLGRQRQELTGSGMDGLEKQGAVAARAGRHHDGARDRLHNAGDQLNGLARVGVEGHKAKVRGDLDDAARRDLVAGKDLGEPDRTHGAQEPLQRLPRLIVWIDQYDSYHHIPLCHLPVRQGSRLSDILDG